MINEREILQGKKGSFIGVVIVYIAWLDIDINLPSKLYLCCNLHLEVAVLMIEK